MPMLMLPDEAPAKQYAAPEDPKGYKGVPPVRPFLFLGDGGTRVDPDDQKRIEYQRRLWTSQDALLRGRDRQVEENIRMLCGQHWTIWNEVLGRHIDLTRYLTDEERRWRQLPVINRLLLWYMLLAARLTENPPIIAFQPSTSDREDAELAEVLDAVWKTLWHQCHMNEVIDDLVAWLIPGGSAYLKSWIDTEGGDFMPLEAPGMMRLLDASGNPIMGADNLPIERYVDAAPYGRDGQTLTATMDTEGNLILPHPEMEREGAIAVSALSALEVRGQWGAGIKWFRKAWHIHRTYCTPEEVYRNFGVELEPEVIGDEAEAVGELQRLVFGSGFYGQAGGRHDIVSSGIGGGSADAKDGFIEVMEGWYRPCDLEGMQRTPDSAGGRLLITTRTKVLRDGPRYAPFPHTSPIHRFDFVNLPGRPQGTSPQEMMNGPARSRNRFYSQIFQHTSLVTNPIKMIDQSTGLQPGQVPNKPGAEVFGTFSGISGDPIRYTRPPDLGSDVYRVLEMLTSEMDDLGNLPGAEGRPPTRDPSGELVKELRFNSDRFVSPTARRLVIGIARLVEDWQVMLPIVWSQGKLLRVGGDENVAQTMMAMPEMFQHGKVNAVPDLESMLPEGRSEREQRYWMWFTSGALGDPLLPETRALYFDLAHFPHTNRENLPGGVDRSQARRENGQLTLGVMPPVLEWYDHAVHLQVHYRFMKGQHYLKLPIPIQEMFVEHVAIHEMALAEMQAEQAMQQAALQAQVNAINPAPDGAGPPNESAPPPSGGPSQPPPTEAAA